MTIPVYQRNVDGSRNYAKANYCLYCGNKYMHKLSVHLASLHVHEEKVKEALLCPKESSERKRLLKMIENEGNFNHNIKVSWE